MSKKKKELLYYMNDSMIERIRCCLLPNRISSNHFMCVNVLEFFPTLRLHDTPDQNSKDQRLRIYNSKCYSQHGNTNNKILYCG